jgi:hypothetical protein
MISAQFIAVCRRSKLVDTGKVFQIRGVAQTHND